MDLAAHGYRQDMQVDHKGVHATSLLLEVLGQRSARHRIERRYEERLAPTFTPFQFLDVGENGLSRVIAWLLDPSGSHAQGDRFLSAFMEWADISWPDAAILSARVRTEAPFTRGSRTRRLDVLVTSGRLAVAIENKLDAKDQLEQVADYLDHLGGCYGREAPLIYLTRDEERAPASDSIAVRARREAERSGRLRYRSYSQLEGWLVHCRRISAAASVTTFLDGMVLHVRRTMLGVEDMDEASQLADDICRSRDKLGAAFEIYQARPFVERRLGEAFVDAIEQKVGEHKDWSVSHEGMTGGDRDAWLLIHFAPDAKFAFGIGFDRARYHEFFYGLRHADPSKWHRRKAPDELIETIEDVWGTVKPGDTWPAWKTPGANDPFFSFRRNPGADPEFWLALHDGSFANSVIRFAEELEQQLKSRRRLAALRRYRGE